MNTAVASFITLVDFAPTDGGLYLLAQSCVDVPSVRLFDPKMERFAQVSI